MNNAEIIITGYWGSEPIWRYKTANEKLLELIAKNNTEKEQQTITSKIN